MGESRKWEGGSRKLKGTKMWIALFLAVLGAEGADEGPSPADRLPPNIVRLTQFGERADFSHDGKRILFIEKTYGDAYELDLETKVLRPVTHHYFHGGYTRALYLKNGDILLSGSTSFDRSEEHTSELQSLRHLVC